MHPASDGPLLMVSEGNSRNSIMVNYIIIHPDRKFLHKSGHQWLLDTQKHTQGSLSCKIDIYIYTLL